MKNFNKVNLKMVIGLLLGAIIFIVAAQLSQQYSEPLRLITSEAGWVGVIFYIDIMMLSIVVAPIGTGFLVPVAANSFGPLLAAIYSIIGWTIGSVIAFVLARYVKQKALKDTLLIKRIQEYEAKLPRWYFYGLIIVLRMALPVDVVSYALGMASSISLRAFVVTTVVGITPFTLVFTYASRGEIWMQTVAVLVGSMVFLGGVLFVKRKFFD